MSIDLISARSHRATAKWIFCTLPMIKHEVFVHTGQLRLRQRSATKMGYIRCLLDILHGATATATANCNTSVSQGVTDMIAVNGSCTHFVRQVSVTPIVVDSIAVAVALCERA